MESMLKVTNLSYSYPAEKEQVLKNISFDVKKNETFSIIGPSGCGKTTLALTLNGLIPNSIKGKLTGEIVVVGKKIKDIPTAELAQEVQILFQSPESQLFALNVEDEISFGLENLNIPWDEIKKRIDNILKKLDIENLRNSSIEELSSGQKQKVALASVLVMNPKILILDEPTANIDPCSVRNFINLLENMKKDLTIIIVEHNLDFVKELSDRVMLVNNGRLVKIARPEVMFKDKTFLKIMSPPSDKKGMLRRIAAKAHIRECGEKEERILNIKNLNFKYPNNVPALRDVNLAVNKGDFIGIVGLNGSGKSTLALNIIGLLKGKGKMLFEGNDISKQDVYERTKNIGYVFQNPNYQLFEENVSREIAFGLKNLNLHAKEIKKRVQDALKMINLVEMAKIDPHILSIGQKRRVTIASILSMLPKLLIIDEPDTGLDYKNAKNLMEHINKLNAIGCTIVLISHNLELVSDYCNKIIYLEDGEIKDINRFLNRQIA